MWKGEIEEEWRRLRESYQDCVLFFRVDGLYFVRGQDVQTVAAELGLKCAGQSVGFDEDAARLYMRLLAKKGMKVADAAEGGVRLVQPREVSSRQQTKQQPKRKFIALDPLLFFGPDKLRSRGVEAWLRRPRNAVRYSRFREMIAADDWKRLREYGELYAFEAGRWYDIDWYLTTFSPSDILLLARAALDKQRKLHCWLVKPKAWRERSRRRTDDRVEPTPSQRIEQLRLL
jgi:hypothetical protein